MAIAPFGFPFLMPTAWAAGGTPPPPEDYEVLASGPIHEAFAEAVALDPEPGIIAPKEPPEIIDEIPPEQRPDGEVEWIPGYWAWDDERNGFIWISGIWRVSPPGRQWIPGYWTPVSKGYQWISGYWLSLEEEEAEYLPEPPESVEIGPSSNAPSADYIWIPGFWQWRYGHYAWRPGYWAAAQPEWMWVPSHYVWTPRGYLYVSGYWDHIVPRRGVLFAPVYFTPSFFLGMNFAFSPGFIISLNIFDDSLFYRPRYSHYYFGDYYAPHYYRQGIYPWFSLHARRVAYDPIYAHQRWKHRHDQRWENHLHDRFNERRAHEELRPSRIYQDHSRPGYYDDSSKHHRPDFVVPIHEAAKSKANVFRFSAMSEKDRNHISKQRNAFRHDVNERRNMETKGHDGSRSPSLRRPVTHTESYSSPPSLDNFRRSKERKSPPNRINEPDVNPGVEPLERKHDNSQKKDQQRNSGTRLQRPEEGRQQNGRGREPVENIQKPVDARERMEGQAAIQRSNGARPFRENTRQPERINDRSTYYRDDRNGKSHQAPENIHTPESGPALSNEQVIQRSNGEREYRENIQHPANHYERPINRRHEEIDRGENDRGGRSMRHERKIEIQQVQPPVQSQEAPQPEPIHEPEPAKPEGQEAEN